MAKNNGAIGVNDDGEIAQYEPGKVPIVTYKVYDDKGNVTIESLSDTSSLKDDTTDADWQAMLDDDDSDLELGDDEDEGDDD